MVALGDSPAGIWQPRPPQGAEAEARCCCDGIMTGSFLVVSHHEQDSIETLQDFKDGPLRLDASGGER